MRWSACEGCAVVRMVGMVRMVPVVCQPSVSRQWLDCDGAGVLGGGDHRRSGIDDLASSARSLQHSSPHVIPRESE